MEAVEYAMKLNSVSLLYERDIGVKSVSPINSRATDNPEETCNKSEKTLDKVFGRKLCFQCSFAPPSVSGGLSIREVIGDPFARLC